VQLTLPNTTQQKNQDLVFDYDAPAAAGNDSNNKQNETSASQLTKYLSDINNGEPEERFKIHS
jgi:hypothetical protein